MSEVISFRLDKDNPREAKALQVLQDWCTRGYPLRLILTEALLKLDGMESDLMADGMLQELSEKLSLVSQQLDKMANSNGPPMESQNVISERGRLADHFVASMKKGAKPGLKLEG